LNYVSVILAVLGKSVIIYGRGKVINELQARHRIPQKYVMFTTTSPSVSALHSSSASLIEEKYLFTPHLFICTTKHCLSHELYVGPGTGKTNFTCPQCQDWLCHIHRLIPWAIWQTVKCLGVSS